jgi:ubiquinone biosynthesis protein
MFQDALRDLPRLREITSVLIRHGLGDIVRRSGVAGAVESAGAVLSWATKAEVLALEPAVRIRLALEELGPTFIKLGQLLATRVDLFPPSWIAEFEKLHSEVAPVPFEALLPELTASLGRSPFEVFDELDTTPYGSASIAQVHRARLKDGTLVVLKIRRPGIVAKVEADLRLLGHLARIIESEMAEARRYQPTEIAAEFARSIEREMDFTTEANHIDRFARNFADDPFIVIPKIYPEFTSETLLVQEHITGVRGVDLAEVEAAGLDKRVLAERGGEAVLRMILIHGFFHADPHPGNVFYLPGNRLALIDFGMVGRLSPRRRQEVIDLMAGLAQMDQAPMLEVLMDWAEDAHVDEAGLASDIDDLVFEYEGTALADVRIGVLIQKFSAIVRNHSIVLPADLTLMFKALMTMEGLARLYDPQFHIVDRLQPILRQAMLERYRPAEMVRRGRGVINDAVNLIGSVPRDIARLLRDARRGKTRIELDLKRLDSVAGKMEATLDRVAVGIMTASLVIGSAIIMTVEGGPTVFGIPVLGALGLFGYVTAFVNSVWVIYGIWRASRR